MKPLTVAQSTFILHTKPDTDKDPCAHEYVCCMGPGCNPIQEMTRLGRSPAILVALLYFIPKSGACSVYGHVFESDGFLCVRMWLIDKNIIITGESRVNVKYCML